MFQFFAWVIIASGPSPAPPPPLVDAGVVFKKPGLDAGVAVVEPPRPMAPIPHPVVAEVDQLRREVGDLKSRTALLERQAAQAEAMSAQLDKLSRQISGLQTQLTDAENRRTEKERQVAERRAQTEQAVSSLGAAQQQLSTGNANVGSALTYAESMFTGTALANVQAAKASLANGDLGSARIWISLAIAEAQASRQDR